MAIAVHGAGFSILTCLATETRVAVAVSRGVVALATAVAASLTRRCGETGQGVFATSARETTVAVAHSITALTIAIAIVGALSLRAVNTLVTINALAHALDACTMSAAVRSAGLVFRTVDTSVTRVAEAFAIFADTVV